MHFRFTLIIVLLFACSAVADTLPAARSLFTFEEKEAARQWQAVNDGVMGGRSEGRFRINSDGHLEFYGTISLANNGGFASVRSRAVSLNLRDGDSIVLRVRGDGREYSLNLYTPSRRMAFSHRVTFPTTSGEWTTVTVPLSKFVATSFGRVVSNAPLKAGQVNSIGLMLADKNPGTFQLEVSSINVAKQSEGFTSK